MENYTKIFKALSDTTRLKIMWLLNSIDSKISVSEVVEVIGENQYNVSRHLSILKNAGLLTEKKEGRCVYYYIIPPNGFFLEYIQQAILAVPEDLLRDQIKKCQERLIIRQK